MTTFLDCTIPSDAFPLGETLEVDAATRVELVQLVPLGETTVPYVWVETDDEEAVAVAVRASPHVATVDTVGASAGRSLFRVTWDGSSNGLLDRLRCHDLDVLRAVCAGGRWEFKLVVDDRTTFAALQSACRDAGLPLTVTRLSNSTARDSALYGLTDKQREALLHAYESGYFDSGTSVGLAN